MPSNEAISAVFAVALAATVLVGLMLLVRWASPKRTAVAMFPLDDHGSFDYA